ncbi:MAG TPA: hypothetical protein DCE42_07930 [Myxococcales bacterium]|nr:hypothetical protein [Myxococcales bacterium]
MMLCDGVGMMHFQDMETSVLLVHFLCSGHVFYEVFDLDTSYFCSLLASWYGSFPGNECVLNFVIQDIHSFNRITKYRSFFIKMQIETKNKVFSM